jgi:hypothetical protein
MALMRLASEPTAALGWLLQSAGRQQQRSPGAAGPAAQPAFCGGLSQAVTQWHRALALALDLTAPSTAAQTGAVQQILVQRDLPRNNILQRQTQPGQLSSTELWLWHALWTPQPHPAPAAPER